MNIFALNTNTQRKRYIQMCCFSPIVYNNIIIIAFCYNKGNKNDFYSWVFVFILC